MSREVELRPPTQPPTKMTTTSQQDKQKYDDLAKDNGHVVATLTKPKETDSKSEVEDDMKKKNDPGLTAQGNQDRETKSQEMEEEAPQVPNEPKPTALKVESNSELSVIGREVEEDGKTNAGETKRKYDKQKDLDPPVKEKEGPQVESNSEVL